MIRVYLDSNILLAKIAGFENNPNQARLASDVFDEIKNFEEIEGVVSHLTLIEVLSVLRSRIGQDKDRLSEAENKIDLHHIPCPHKLKQSDSSWNYL